ncbi:hypothetical protein [Exiguobacterium sp. s48]|nr:hypothetical protein [Exiguobacterium sp. s48]
MECIGTDTGDLEKVSMQAMLTFAAINLKKMARSERLMVQNTTKRPFQTK